MAPIDCSLPNPFHSQGAAGPRTPWLTYAAPLHLGTASSAPYGVEDIGPVLSPPLSHMFTSILRQCMRLMEDAEAGLPEAEPINYKVRPLG